MSIIDIPPELEHVELIQEWFESEESKTGWDSSGWTYVDGSELSLVDSMRCVGITDYDKYNNPIRGYL